MTDHAGATLGRQRRERTLVASIPQQTRISKVISGGQSGIDRAALDAAIACRIPIGGWCPRGRRAEDGRIPARYSLMETPSRDYRERTRWNVRDSDGTLILTLGPLTAGTALTWRQAQRLRRPVMIADLRQPRERLIRRANHWVARHRVRALNVAGPRASLSPEGYPLALAFLMDWWASETCKNP
jgi:predicted Rossmann-fold nucleotide-binding protein